jgi:hypothetical protein
MVAVRIWIPGESGRWVQLGNAEDVHFDRVPCVGEIIGRHDEAPRYQVKLVSQVTPPGTIPATIHAVPVDWEEVIRKAHPSFESASLTGQ